jgi:hypothetical protein
VFDCSYNQTSKTWTCNDLGLCGHDTVNVTMTSPRYLVAVINEGKNAICMQGNSLDHQCILTASNSYDPNNDNIEYTWFTGKLRNDRTYDKTYVDECGFVCSGGAGYSYTDGCGVCDVDDASAAEIALLQDTLLFSPHFGSLDSEYEGEYFPTLEDTKYDIYLKVSESDIASDMLVSRMDTITVTVKATWPYAQATVNSYKIDENGTYYLVTGVTYEVNGFNFDNNGSISGSPLAEKVFTGYYDGAGIWKETSKRSIAIYENSNLVLVPGYQVLWESNSFSFIPDNIISSFTPLTRVIDKEIDLTVYDVSDPAYTLSSFTSSINITVEENKAPVAITNYKYGAMKADDVVDCQTLFDEYKIKKPSQNRSCWQVRVPQNPDTIIVLAGSIYTLDGTHSYDNTPTGVMNYEWKSPSGAYIIPETLSASSVSEIESAFIDTSYYCSGSDFSTKVSCVSHGYCSDTSYDFGVQCVQNGATNQYYKWLYKLNYEGLVETSNSANPKVYLPSSIDDNYVFTLQVSDGQDESAIDSLALRTQRPSTPTPPAEFYAKVIPDVNHIQLVWTSDPENILDSLTEYRDFEGYNIYRSTDGGITWGSSGSKLYNFNGEHVGWRPYAQFDLTEEKDTTTCMYKLDNIGVCASEIYRKVDIVGSDPWLLRIRTNYINFSINLRRTYSNIIQFIHTGSCIFFFS